MKNQTDSNLGLFAHYDELDATLYLPNGEALLKSLLEKWREMHTQMGFHFIHTFGDVDLMKMHTLVFKKEKYMPTARLASFGPRDHDFATIFCKRGAVVEELISSLHFLEQTIKIFGFETRVYLVASPGVQAGSLLKNACEQKKISYREESSSDECRVDFRLIDPKGTEVKGPFVALTEYNEGIDLIYRSMFGSLERWIGLLIEQSRSKKS